MATRGLKQLVSRQIQIPHTQIRLEQLKSYNCAILQTSSVIIELYLLLRGQNRLPRKSPISKISEVTSLGCFSPRLTRMLTCCRKNESKRVSFRPETPVKNFPFSLCFYYNKAVYTASVAPRRAKSESVTESITDGPTDGRTDGHTLL